MKYFERTITKREKINVYGKLGFVVYIEFFKTNDEKFIATMNKNKRIKFSEVDKNKKFIHIQPNVLYEMKKS